MALGAAVAALILALLPPIYPRFLYRTSMLAPSVLALTGLTVGIVALAALFVPVWRAHRASLQQVLRMD